MEIVKRDLDSNNIPDGFTYDQSAAIRLFTYNLDNEEETLKYHLNFALRPSNSNIRLNLVLWRPYLQLFYAAFQRLPSIIRAVYHGISSDLSETYRTGEELPLLGFIWCTLSVEATCRTFPTDTKRAVFAFDSPNCKDIRKHSYRIQEQKLLSSRTLISKSSLR